MGTLGCVSDMLQRDKENRALRKIGREWMKETRRRLLEVVPPLPPPTSRWNNWRIFERIHWKRRNWSVRNSIEPF